MVGRAVSKFVGFEDSKALVEEEGNPLEVVTEEDSVPSQNDFLAGVEEMYACVGGVTGTLRL